MTNLEICDLIVRLNTEQLDVMRLKDQGQTHKQIARNLHITPRTVSRRVQSVLEAVGAESVIEACILLCQAGALQIPHESCPKVDTKCP